MSNRQSHYIQSDLILILLSFMAVSLLAIYNAQQLEQYADQHFVLKQVVWFAIGISFIIAVQFLDLDQLYKASLFIYIFGVLLLILLWVSPPSIAREINGAKSWFTAFPGFSLQPSEFTKMAFLLFLSAVIAKHHEKYQMSTLNSDIRLLIKIALSTALPVLFILNESDLGTSVVYVFVACVLIILSGIDWKIISVLFVGGASLIAGAVALIVNFPDLSQAVLGIQPYQINRVLIWFDPTIQGNDTFHIDRSMLAVGSGQLVGKGLNNLQVQLPEAHTDFVFSVIGESFGFIGSAVVVILYFILFYKLVTLGLKVYKFNPFGSYICFGYMSVLLIHAFQNIGMTIGIMPITGIPLLLISYGGSSILSTMIGFALIYRVAVENSVQNDYLFK